MDARIVRTRQRLQESLFELARERPIEDVSVSDVAQRAGVNRTTFYLHYSDKETLLADALDMVAARAGAELGPIDVAAAEPPTVLTTFLTHVDEHADLYRRIFSEPGYGVVLSRLRGQIIDAITRLAEEPVRAKGTRIPIAFIAEGVAGSILGMLGAWIRDNDRVRPAEAARWIWAIVPLPSDVRA